MRRFQSHYALKRNILIALSIFIFVLMYLFSNAAFSLRTLSTVFVLALFYVADKVFDIRFEQRHYAFFLLLVVTGFLLSPLYFVYPQWDKIQHLIGPFLLSSLVFYMVRKLMLENKWKLGYTFFTVLSILVIFEIGEYLLDYLFGLRLQGVYLRDLSGFEKFNILVAPLDDTMQDLCFGILGTSLYCIYKGWQFRKQKQNHKGL